jgi:futalosine hydrolase
MKIVITSATEFETKGIKSGINAGFNVSFHTSGVGMLSSTFALTKMVSEQRPDFIIQVGIAGCFDTTIELGTVVAVKDEFLGDTGVEENRELKDIFDLNLGNKDGFPFSNKRLSNKWLQRYNFLNLQEVTAVTINEVTTREERIRQLQQKYQPLVESMEGAPLHYVGLQTSTPFIQIRAISNYIGERDKTKWQIKTALDNLQTTVLKYIDELYKMG